MRPFARSRAARSLRRTTRRLLRRRSLFLLLTAGLALVTFGVFRSLLASASAGAARYGDPRRAVVATRDLRPGDVVAAGDVEVVRLPAGSLPDTALRVPPAGRALRAPAFEGQVLVEGQLAPPGASPAAASTGAGRRGLAIPRGDGALPVRRGDRVDVLGIDPESGGIVALAPGCPVIAVDERVTVVSVEEADVGAVAAAIAGGTAILALTGR